MEALIVVLMVCLKNWIIMKTIIKSKVSEEYYPIPWHLSRCNCWQLLPRTIPRYIKDWWMDGDLKVAIKLCWSDTCWYVTILYDIERFCFPSFFKKKNFQKTDFYRTLSNILYHSSKTGKSFDLFDWKKE